MFNQFKNALEQVAQQPIRILDAAAQPSENHSENGARSSLDMNGARTSPAASLTSSQLAESAISSLRKSFVTQRRNSSEVVKPQTTSPPPAASSAPSVRKSTLEERLKRATQIAATGDSSSTSSTTKPGTPPTMTRGRTDSSASQTSVSKTPASRVASPSPMTRGRTTETPAARLSSSRTASPAAAAKSRTSELSGTGSKPPSRAGSPAPTSTATRTTSRPSSRASSPAPVARTTSRPPSRAASPAPLTKPASRAASPAPVARTRVSDLGIKTTRAASPSPLSRNQVPVRRGSVAIGSTPLGSSVEPEAEPSKSAETPAGNEKSSALVGSEQDGDVTKKGEVEDEEAADITGGHQVKPPPSEVAPVAEKVEAAVVPEEEEADVTSSAEVAEPLKELIKEAEAVDHGDGDVVSDTPLADASTSSEPEVAVTPPTEAQVPTKEPEKPDAPVTPAQDVLSGTVPAAEEKPAEASEAASEASSAAPVPPIAASPISSPKSPVTETVAPKTPTLAVGPSDPSDPLVASPTANPAPESSIQAETSSSAQPSPTIPQPKLNGTPIVDRSAEVDNLQARLKEVEQRFSDVSTSFKRLQAEKLAADAILKDNTPLQGFSDADGLREFFSNIKTKDEVFQEELKRLTGKLEVQEDRLEELRETHKLESHSRSEEVKKLKTQLVETEALFEAAQRATTNVEQASEKHQEDIARLEKEVEQTKALAKEEEEKRVKAISLLKTVRQKLVKAEKDKDDVVREMSQSKEKERGDKDRDQAERLTLQRELETAKAVHEQETAGLKARFEKDLAAMRDRYEQEIAALRGQQELDLATNKSSHAKELAAKSSQITTLENSLNTVTRDKNAFFDQLQLRQAEVESAQAHLDSLQHQNTELEFQLREANDRLALLKEEYAELLRESETRSREPTTSPDEVARMVAAAEAKYEVKIAEMKRNVSVLEKERHESEADWSRKLKEKVKDLDDLKKLLGTATRSRENEESVLAGLKAELEKAQGATKALQREAGEVPLLREQLNELQRSSKEQEEEINMKIHVLEKTIEENKNREAQMKQANKTLRDELRKVQSSAALLERQRNPGVGYWTARTGGEANGSATATASRTSFSSVDTPSRSDSPAPTTATSISNPEEEVNLEYLRNVILQFFEHKEMRPHLVKVLSIILHFTPQETRRLVAKV